MKTPFHLSLPCRNVLETRKFYLNVIGAGLGRNASNWVDFDVYGNQLTFVKTAEFTFPTRSYSFEGSIIPAFHFGFILQKNEWNHLFERLSKDKMVKLEQASFLEDQIGGHMSFFVTDPNGYHLEFKCFNKEDEIFAK